MSTLHIIVYSHMSHDMGNSVMQVPNEPNLGYQTVSIGDSEESSKPLPRNTAFVCIIADEDCFVSFNNDLSPHKADFVPVFSGERLYFGTGYGTVIKVRGAQL